MCQFHVYYFLHVFHPSSMLIHYVRFSSKLCFIPYFQQKLNLIIKLWSWQNIQFAYWGYLHVAKTVSRRRTAIGSGHQVFYFKWSTLYVSIFLIFLLKSGSPCLKILFLTNYGILNKKDYLNFCISKVSFFQSLISRCMFCHLPGVITGCLK